MVKKNILPLALLATLLGSTASHAAMPEPELVFNCELENGKYALIRLNEQVPTYYYGPLEKVELTLPKIAGDKTQVRVGNMAFAGGGATYYRFINGNYSYVVYSGIGRGWEFTGLKVYQGKKLIMKKACNHGGFINNGYTGENLVNEADTGDDGTYGYAD
ncbi:hypothetical protein [Cedecea davisae]|uniref:hypothetical protein n=1 Tax=Cedecea davisae TaxID=158484 RepID=UPI0020A21E18|nr:hypothetical protein [Cedecea davisae]